jgi:hypothetical protein
MVKAKVVVTMEASQSRAEGQPKDQSNKEVKVATNDNVVMEPSTVPSTPVTMASRTMQSNVVAADPNNDLSSPTPSVNSNRASGNKLRPSSANVTASGSTGGVPTTPAGRRVASAGTLRNPVLASLANDNHTLSPIADCPHSPSSPIQPQLSIATPQRGAPPSSLPAVSLPVVAAPAEGLALVAGEKVALKAMAADHVATLTKKEVNRQPMFIPWEKPALGKLNTNTATLTAASDATSTDAPRPTTSGGRPTTSSGRRLAAVPTNLDRLMNKTHKPSKHKREQMAAAAAAAGGAPTESKGELVIVGAAISNGNIDADKENKCSNDNNNDMNDNDEKKSKRPQPLKRRLAPLAPIAAKPSSPMPSLVPIAASSTSSSSSSSSGSNRPTTSSGRPMTSSGRPGTSAGTNVAPHADTLAQMRRDKDKAVTYTSVERLLVDVHSLPVSVSKLILKLSSIKPAASTPFELVKPKQPPAWEIRF